MTKRPSPEAIAKAAAFKARVAEVSNKPCPQCGHGTTTGMLNALGTCSACAYGLTRA